jgi:hypothetical protein
LSSADGARWSEVPYEALHSLRDGRGAPEALWDALVGDDGLPTLLHLAEVRYLEGSFGDPFVLAPIVEFAFCEQRDPGKH